MGVKLREKKLKDGSISLYLDIAHKRSRKYEFLDIHITNKRKDLNDNQEKRKLAERIRSQREYELIIKGSGLSDQKKKLSDFLVYMEDLVYSEKKANSLWVTSLNKLKEYVGKGLRLPFIEITEKWVLDYQNYLQSHVKDNSVYNYLNTVNISLNKAVAQKIIIENPFKNIPKHLRARQKETERIFLTIDELNKMANAKTKIHNQVKQVFLFSCFTGLRWGDVNRLRWDDIDITKEKTFERYTLRFNQKKTKTFEYFPLSEQAIDIIEQRKNDYVQFNEKKIFNYNEKKELNLGKDYIFPYLTQVNPASKAQQKKVNDQLKIWAEDAGIKKHLHFHVSRHTFATLALTYGTDIYTVSKLLGHKNIQTTTIYAKVIDKLKDEAVAKLPVIGK